MDQGFLRTEAESWLKWDPNPNTRDAVDAALSKEDWTTLQEYFGHGRLDFGTAGLRGRMGAGTCAMNDLTVIQTTQGLATVLEEEFGERGKAKGVVIGYDHRADAGVSSHGLALATAAVLLHRGFRVLLYRGLVPTPLVPFGVRLHGACAGVMITASHNPKQDNGYKLYWANAVQIIPPIDQRVATATTSCLSPWLSPYPSSDDTVRSHPRCLDPTTATVDAYLSQLSAKLCRFPQDNAKRQGGNVVYTPMHGVGEPFASAAFRAFHLPPFTPVPEQARADPAFPTVRFPNPEEKGALSLACALAEKQGAWLVLANDPDADRLAVAERGEDGGGWHVFSGNDIGTMLGCWQWEQWRGANPDAPASDAAVVVSTVSSKMLRAVAKAEGFEFHETLTGFKWIGNKALELQSGGKSVLLGYEEAIGFCVAPQVVPDKDGVSASAMVAEMAMHLRDQRGGLSLHRYLRSLHAKYGEFASANGYFFLPSSQPSVVPDIFARLRNGGKYWEAVGTHRIKSIRDLTSPGYDSSTADKRPSLPVSSGTQMLTYEMEEGVVLTLRTSGTEPKLKYYSEMQGQPGVPLEQVERRLKELLAVLLEELLQPDQNGLRRP